VYKWRKVITASVAILVREHGSRDQLTLGENIPMDILLGVQVSSAKCDDEIYCQFSHVNWHVFCQ
jgi:hypothetical protein